MGNASARDWDPIIGKRFNPLETVNTRTHTLAGVTLVTWHALLELKKVLLSLKKVLEA